MADRLNFMLDIIQKLGDFQHQHFRKDIQFDTKSGAMDVVSFVDRECEQMFRNAVNNYFPEDAIMGEETYDPDVDYKKYDKLWIIDPLDGTLMYKRGIPTYCPMIAYIENGIILYSALFFPETNDLCYANNDGAFHQNGTMQTSKIHNLNQSLINIPFKTLMKKFEYTKLAEINTHIGRIIDSCPTAQRLYMCATGQTDGGINLGGGLWDIIPGGFLVQQAGGKVTNFGSDSWDIFNQNVIFSNGHIHTELQQLLKG